MHICAQTTDGRKTRVEERGGDEVQDHSDIEGIPGDVQARFALIEQRIGHALTETQADEVRARIARSIALGVVLRAYPLTNADEPEIAFDPFLGGER